MKYIIDDEELKIQIASMIGDYRGYAIEQDIVNQEVDKIILKSKTPVEEITAEEIRKGLINTGMFKLFIQKEATQ